MSKIFKSVSKAVSGIFGGAPKAPRSVPSYAPQGAREATEGQMAGRRAGMAASGRRLDEEELEQQFGASWMKNTGFGSGYWR